MTAPARQPQARSALPPAWPMIRAMAGVGMLCGLLIATAHITTRPIIERNEAEALREAVFQVLPGAVSSASQRWLEEGRFAPVAADGAKGSAMRVHLGYDAAGALVGVAIESAGMGYQDVIRVLYGYSPGASAIVGLRVLESRETPGLGDRIETDPVFRANFEALDVSLTADGAQIAHPIELVKPGEKEAAWQIDSITGATISSEAIARILRESTMIWIPRIERQRSDFGQGGVE